LMIRTLSLCLLFAALAALPLHAGNARLAKVIRLTEPIRLDGILNESVWRNNPHIGDLVQVEPRPGERPTEATQVWVAYNEDALFIAVRCQDSQPNKIVAREMVRDAFLMSDDSIEIILDTFHDNRNAYYFATNPLGVLVDGRISENRMMNREWDGIWMVRTSIDETGWSAEFEIPFKTLGFSTGNGSWGFNISRHLGRNREFSRWASPSLDVRFYNVARAGAIEGLSGLSQGVGLDIKPYAIGGFTRDIEAAKRVQGIRDGGADIFYRITPNLVSSTTFNTDFAETEADARQVNLTRFSLFFPEKRTFFLEDAGVFDFAGGLTATGSRPGGRGPRRRNVDLMPFFSRRIGLASDEDGNQIEIPIRVGEKLTGKVGRFDIGLLDVQTGAVGSLEGQNLAVGRIKANFLRQSYIGAIVTHGDPTGETSNALGGIDMRLATANFLNRGKNFSLSLFGLRTRTTGMKGQDFAYGIQALYPNDRFSGSFSRSIIQENFNPALGFVPRTGVRITTGRFEYGPRPKFWGLRQASFGISYQDYHNLTYRSTETQRINITPLELLFNSGDSISYSISPNLERLYEPFEIHDGVIIPVGKYRTWAHQVNLFTSGSRPVSFRLGLENGSFYSGKRKQVETGIDWRKNRHLSLSLDAEQNWVNLKEGKFVARVYSTRLDYAFTPLIGLSSLVQYDSDSENIGLQTRFRWILKPGNELFFVVNHSWQEDAFDRFASYQSRVAVKLNYTFRF